MSSIAKKACMRPFRLAHALLTEKTKINVDSCFPADIWITERVPGDYIAKIKNMSQEYSSVSLCTLCFG